MITTREEMILYRALSGCGSILQGVRALRYKGKDYIIEGMVLGAYPCRLGLQVVEKTEVNSRGSIVGGKVLTRLEYSLAYHAR